MVTIYAATTNAGKLREFAECGRGEGVEVVSLPGVREMPVPVEDADSFMGNAELKAVAYSLRVLESGTAGLLVMADDSGLEVDALGGAPRVRSARFAEDAGVGVGDAANNRLLLERLRDAGDRRARFVCALAVARDGVVAWRAEGVVEGEILREPRGENGFGYDPLFYVAEVGSTAAELAAEEKWRVSHRGRAFRELLVAMRG